METIELSTFTIIVLVIVALLAGFIDTLVGGGGLITIPALLVAGLPPIVALGTNKLQAVAGSGTASLTLLLRRKIQFREVKWLMLFAFSGSVLGSLVVQFINAEALTILIPVVIILIAVYFILSSTQSLTEQQPRASEAVYRATAVPGIGFYDGMLGPGTGSFFVLAGVSLRGQSIVQATILAKTMNFATNAASLIVFLMFGKVVWLVGLLMMIGQFIGASLATRVLLKINPMVLRYLVIAMCAVILAAWGIKSF